MVYMGRQHQNVIHDFVWIYMPARNVVTPLSNNYSAKIEWQFVRKNTQNAGVQQKR